MFCRLLTIRISVTMQFTVNAEPEEYVSRLDRFLLQSALDRFLGSAVDVTIETTRRSV